MVKGSKMRSFIIGVGLMFGFVFIIIALSAFITLIFHLINSKKYKYTQFTYCGKLSDSSEKLDISNLKLTNSIKDNRGE